MKRGGGGGGGGPKWTTYLPDELGHPNYRTLVSSSETAPGPSTAASFVSSRHHHNPAPPSSRRAALRGNGLPAPTTGPRRGGRVAGPAKIGAWPAHRRRTGACTVYPGKVRDRPEPLRHSLSPQAVCRGGARARRGAITMGPWRTRLGPERTAASSGSPIDAADVFPTSVAFAAPAPADIAPSTFGGERAPSSTVNKFRCRRTEKVTAPNGPVVSRFGQLDARSRS